ncbi:hypothetical protein IFM89_021726 [Coptis chinensis]|uniref:Uncharacterized protein n=1 Tax=Coptis chinensis TaxID=261450 RepID=A0A835LSD2_9MAGN|nr:hypothetical protein IFM89_021726 [Coptis chinensis]
MITKNEARSGVMRLIVGGGRANEKSESRGDVIVGVRTLSEGDRVGTFSREQVFLKDTDERACAYIAGPAPNSCGFTTDGQDLFDSVNSSLRGNDEPLNSSDLLKNDLQINLSGHPLFFGITLGLLAEIINSRLFYLQFEIFRINDDVSFELSLFDRLKLGWYVVSVTSTPAKVYKAVDACKNVLRGKRTLVMRHEAETKSNAYWLGLLAHLQATSVPRKDIACIKKMPLLYEVATIEDVYLAYEFLKVDEDSLVSCMELPGLRQAKPFLVRSVSTNSYRVASL